MSAAPHPPKIPPTIVPAPDEEDEDDGRRSYKERKAESHELGRLAKRLVDSKPSVLADLALPDDVLASVAVARGFERGARVRELRRVVALLRSHGIVSLDAMERDAGRMRRQRTAREHTYEAWRERLMSEGDRALAELVAQHPAADAQRLRQLVRQARRDPGSDKTKQTLRTVLRLVRQACEADAPGSPSTAAGELEGADADELADAGESTDDGDEHADVAADEPAGADAEAPPADRAPEGD